MSFIYVNTFKNLFNSFNGNIIRYKKTCILGIFFCLYFCFCFITPTVGYAYEKWLYIFQYKMTYTITAQIVLPNNSTNKKSVTNLLIQSKEMLCLPKDYSSFILGTNKKKLNVPIYRFMFYDQRSQPSDETSH